MLAPGSALDQNIILYLLPGPALVPDFLQQGAMCLVNAGTSDLGTVNLFRIALSVFPLAVLTL